jgi:hypothetical protein
MSEQLGLTVICSPAVVIKIICVAGAAPEEGEGVDPQLRQDFPGAKIQQRYSHHKVCPHLVLQFLFTLLTSRWSTKFISSPVSWPRRRIT